LSANPALVRPRYDVARVRADFPILARSVHGKPLVYLDSAASSQRPLAVLRAVEQYETTLHANVHRGVHSLSQWATEAYEHSRETVRRFINARSSREIVFVRGTTEAINLVTNSWGRGALKPGDEVLISQLEHHANIVPWQMVCAATGARLRAVPITSTGELDLEAFKRLLNPRTRMVAMAHVSNALGTVRTSTCVSWIVISMPSPVTRCTAPPASACSTGANRCWQRCRRGRAAAR
jgi:cysteine desulfurase/selenocysteine lyase